MRQRFIKLGRMGLLVVLISSLLVAFAGIGPVAGQGPNPVRVLPAQVSPGDEFQVIITWTAPADNFNAIGLTDLCPVGWTVSVDRTWCTPDADVENHPTPDQVDYVWFGPYASGAGFTAVYNVQVPGAATAGNYTFPDGPLEYYIGGEGPYIEAIAGDTEVEVVRDTPPPVGGSAYPINKLLLVLPWIAVAAAVAVGMTILGRKRRTQS